MRLRSLTIALGMIWVATSPWAHGQHGALGPPVPPPIYMPTAAEASEMPPQQQPVAANADAKKQPTVEELQKQLELQNQSIQAQNKQILLLAKQVGQQGPAVDDLKVQAATLEARSKQAAQRDQELANGVSNLTEQFDASQRYGPILPSPLKELFLPATNETPLSIYGALAVGYQKLQGQPSGFYFGEFSPDFFLKLNDWIFMEAEIAVSAGGSVSATFAQADFLINDWLTIIAGKFVAPVGWFNERTNNPWINKLPGDAGNSGPLLWAQVLPATSLLGLQARGAFYLGCSPIKMEYAAYISNGFNLAPATPGAPTINELADLGGLLNTEVTNTYAVGGRLGLWWPEVGIAGGISGLVNGPYVSGFNDSLTMWALDLNYHKGNWDIRTEYGVTYQQAQSFSTDNIRRQGFFTQFAYRAYDAANPILQKLEFVYRYSYVDFRGLDPAAMAASPDFSIFGTPLDVPLRRQQNEFGINYYLYPRMVIKFAYQINDEPGNHQYDNQFISELAWGW
jgi:hypothetical protein